SFFWFPLILERRLVQGDQAASGLYAYFYYFIDPLTLIGIGTPTYVSSKVAPVVLGLITAASMLLLVQRRSVRPPQWRMVAMLWLTTIAAAFMMGPASRPVWEVLPLLHRVQFPLRLILVLTVTTAALTGCIPAYSRLLAVLGIATALWTTGARAPMFWQYRVFETRADILATFVRPDAVDEWLPRGARSFTKADVPRDVR